MERTDEGEGRVGGSIMKKIATVRSEAKMTMVHNIEFEMWWV